MAARSFPQRVPSGSPPCSAASPGACGCHRTPPAASPHGPGHRRARIPGPIQSTGHITIAHVFFWAVLVGQCCKSCKMTSEMTTGRCSMGYPGTSPRCSCCLNPCRLTLFTPLLSTHSSLVLHGGDVLSQATTVGMLSTALKAPEISSDLFQKCAC